MSSKIEIHGFSVEAHENRGIIRDLYFKAYRDALDARIRLESLEPLYQAVREEEKRQEQQERQKTYAYKITKEEPGTEDAS